MMQVRIVSRLRSPVRGGFDTTDELIQKITIEFGLLPEEEEMMMEGVMMGGEDEGGAEEAVR